MGLRKDPSAGFRYTLGPTGFLQGSVGPEHVSGLRDPYCDGTALSLSIMWKPQGLIV